MPTVQALLFLQSPITILSANNALNGDLSAGINTYAYWSKEIQMNRTGKQFISNLQKHNKRIEQDTADIEWKETQGSVGDDVLDNFRRELRRSLQYDANSCLSASQQEKDERNQHELLRYDLGKKLAKSQEARLDSMARRKEFQQRFEK